MAIKAPEETPDTVTDCGSILRPESTSAAETAADKRIPINVRIRVSI
jgi:hypothetical protein